MEMWKKDKYDMYALRDLIRWDCLIGMGLIAFICVGSMGWILGILVYTIIIYGLTAGGGSWMDLDVYPLPKIYNNKCSANIKDCKICLNTHIHDHEFNKNYQKSLRWYEKII